MLSHIYFNSLFANPLLIVSTVLYWHSTNEKSTLLLCLLLLALCVFHFLGLKIKSDGLVPANVTDKTFFRDAIFFYFFGRTKNKIFYIKTGLLVEIFLISIISSILAGILLSNFGLTYSIIASVLASPLIYIPFFKTNQLKLYSNKEEKS